MKALSRKMGECPWRNFSEEFAMPAVKSPRVIVDSRSHPDPGHLLGRGGNLLPGEAGASAWVFTRHHEW
jgi:hypothetical protein